MVHERRLTKLLRSGLLALTGAASVAAAILAAGAWDGAVEPEAEVPRQSCSDLREGAAGLVGVPLAAYLRAELVDDMPDDKGCVLDYLLDLARADASPEVRIEALRWLVTITDERPVQGARIEEVILAGLRDPLPNVRRWASQYAVSLHRKAGGLPDGFRSQLADALVAMAVDHADLAQAASGLIDLQVRDERAAWTLRRLIDAELAAPKPYVAFGTWQAAEACGELVEPSPEWHRWFQDLTRVRSDEVRSEAAFRLGKWCGAAEGENASVPEALDVARSLLYSQDLDLRIHAITGVGHAAPDCASLVPDLIALVQMEDLGNGWVTGQSAFALARFGPQAEEAVPVLVDRLQGPHASVVALALGRMGDVARPAIPALLAALRRSFDAPPVEPSADPCCDDDSEIALWAAVGKALGQLDPSGAALDAFLVEAMRSPRTDLRTSFSTIAASWGDIDGDMLRIIVDLIATEPSADNRREFEEDLSEIKGRGGPVCAALETARAEADRRAERGRLAAAAEWLECP